ncbi:MAG: VCBS repeat-containing protein [Acidobacteria bacterium]|nr:VCBS repeat-containing protein [Acidobacteriota bacterium]MCW5950366.1 VCBS repeat-containing protein [Pyrinomonadaceae bacterium]
MLRKLKIGAFVSAAALFVFAAAASAQAPLVVENFNYTAGTLLTNSGYTAHSGAGTNSIAATAGNLTYTNWPGNNVGNQITMTTSGEDVNRVFTVQSSGDVYAGFLARFTAAGPDAGGGDYFFHLGPDPIGTTFRARVFVKADGSNNLAFGISKAANNTTPASISFTGFNYSLNTTYLFVVKYSIVAGATNDTVSMIVNPTLGGAEPAATVTAPDTSATDINPATFAFRQGTAASSPALSLDSVRIATSWAALFNNPVATNVDFNGDGKTDWSVARNVSGQIYWFNCTNGVAEPGCMSTTPFGLAASDLFTPSDFDGDGKTDIAVWRQAPATQAAFYILQSSTNTVRADFFGQDGDDPAIVADYTGDGKADPAVFRCPPASGSPAQCYFFYRASSGAFNGQIVFEPWGFGRVGDMFPLVGDFDGDGKGDFMLQTAGTGGQAYFWLRTNTTNTISVTQFGTTTDFLIPGDYDGDGKADIMVRRTIGGARYHFARLSSNPAASTPPNTGLYAVFGITGDTSAPGDYNGDGRTDIAVWRANADPSQNYFYVLNSGSGSVTTFEWGSQNDFAVAGWAVH